MRSSKIPERGYVFGYSANQDILFDEYRIENGNIVLKSGEIFNEQDYPEYHCFDDTKEYRIVTTNGQRREMTLCADEEVNNPEFVVYREEQYLKDEYCPGKGLKKLIVVNRFCFNENDSMYLKDFRLAGVTDGEE